MYPHAGKFHIPVIDILQMIRQGFIVQPVQIPGKLSLLRVMSADKVIGFDRSSNATIHISVISDAGVKIVTAFTGVYCFVPCNDDKERGLGE